MRSALLPHRGFTLVELLAALVVSAVICSVMAAAIASQARLTEFSSHMAEATDATWTAAAVLQDELRVSRHDTDLSAVSGNALEIRAFRGIAIVCDTTDGQATVRWSGARMPEPVKDSLLIHERANAFRLSAVKSNCPVLPRETRIAFDLDATVRPGDVLLLFERGAYHLSDGALRWRAGAAGRQPLTAEVFRDAQTGFEDTQAPRWVDLATESHPYARSSMSVPLRVSLHSLNETPRQ
jgi:prepilin-type N-terminal cleavage/methylation domain-containing protein